MAITIQFIERYIHEIQGVAWQFSAGQIVEFDDLAEAAAILTDPAAICLGADLPEFEDFD